MHESHHHAKKNKNSQLLRTKCSWIIYQITRWVALWRIALPVRSVICSWSEEARRLQRNIRLSKNSSLLASIIRKVAIATWHYQHPKNLQGLNKKAFRTPPKICASLPPSPFSPLLRPKKTFYVFQRVHWSRTARLNQNDHGTCTFCYTSERSIKS